MLFNSRQRVFDRAAREFAEYPWGALNFDNVILERLVASWDGQETDAAFLDAAIREFARTDGPVLVLGSDLATVLLGTLAQVAGRQAIAFFDDEYAGKSVLAALSKLDVSAVEFSDSPATRLEELTGQDEPRATLVVGRHGAKEAVAPSSLPPVPGAGRVSVVLAIDDGTEADVVTVLSDVIGSPVRLISVADGYAVLRYGNSGPESESESDAPEVSVGIPTYNSESSIGKSIDSILSQSYPNVSLHLSDNASLDGTQAVCLDYVRRDQRVSYYRLPENIGVFRNYNEVFRKSRSRYFKWQSSNDWCDPKFLSACVDVLESNPHVVLVYPSVELVDDNGVGEKYAGDLSLEMNDPAERFIYLLQNIQLCNVFNGVYRTDAMRQTRLNGSYRGSDGILMAELALRGKFVLLPEVLWSRSMTESTSTKLRTTDEKKQFFKGTAQNYDQRIQWKYTHALFSSVVKADIGLSSKLRCLVYLCRRTLWASRELLTELLPRR